MLRYIMPICFAVLAASCGEKSTSKRHPVLPSQNGDAATDPDAKFNPAESYVLKGRIMIEVGDVDADLTSMNLFGNASASARISASVAPSVRFELTTDNFVEPVDPEDGEISYGSLDVTDLRDNDLSVCGNAGDERCTVAVIRIFSTGTPDAGLWNDADAFGLPIKTGQNTVGLDEGGAVNIQEIAIGNTRVVRLRDFSGGNQTPVAVPVAVDFTDASAGSYRSTLVIEYLVQ